MIFCSTQPQLPGCPKSCPANHVGVLLEGSVNIVYDDGTTETISTGQPYMVRPGHLPEVLGNVPAVMIEFSETPLDHAK